MFHTLSLYKYLVVYFMSHLISDGNFSFTKGTEKTCTNKIGNVPLRIPSVELTSGGAKDNDVNVFSEMALHQQ